MRWLEHITQAYDFFIALSPIMMSRCIMMLEFEFLNETTAINSRNPKCALKIGGRLILLKPLQACHQP